MRWCEVCIRQACTASTDTLFAAVAASDDLCEQCALF